MLIGKNITRIREIHPLFKDISLILNKGESIIIKGPNGAGKSTLLRLLAGLIRPQPQTLFWKGEEITTSSLPIYQQELLYIGHKLALHPEARIKDQVQLWQDFYKVSKQKIGEALKEWDLARMNDPKITHLSHGQQKRLSLSRIHWLNRSLWILDEPLGGLDEDGQKILLLSLSKHLAKGGMALIATHEIGLWPSSMMIALGT